MAALPGVLGLEVVRHYNSAFSGIDSKTGILGRGWKLSYETQLEQLNTFTIAIVQADGTRHEFERTPKQPVNQFRGASGLVTVLTVGSTTEYVWRWSNGRSLSFNQSGRLTQIAAPTGEFVTLQYDPRGWLIKVTDPQNRSLEITYLDKAIAQARREQGAPVFSGVQAIQTPLGQYRYQYGSVKTAAMSVKAIELVANLVKVIYPSAVANDPNAITRLYHYENPQWPTLLTGITIQGVGTDGVAMNERLVTWAYDEQGRANLSVKGYSARLAVDPTTKQVLIPKRLAAGTGIEQVTLTWPSAGTTVLTNSLGQETIYKSRKVNGQYQLMQVVGAGCATCGPVNMRYGYDAQARLTEQTQLDVKQAPIVTSKINYDSQGRVSKVSQIGYLNAKAQTAQVQTRYEYGNNQTDEPSLIARPSAMIGKEHKLEFKFNEYGQITQLTETGYSPVNSNGQLLRKGETIREISRTTNYRYLRINNRSLLKEVDGPLANGPLQSPLDSDVTQVRYDARGDYIVELIKPTDFKSITTYDHAGRIQTVKDEEGFQTTFTYTGEDVSLISKTGLGWTKPRHQNILHNAVRAPVEIGSGTKADKDYKAIARQSFDVAQRLQWVASAIGVLQQNVYDTEGNLLETGQHTNRISRVNRFNNFTAPWASSRRQSSINETVGFSDELVDDFGRTVATLSADSGTTTRMFNEADQLVGSVDAQGHTASYKYDLRGRIQAQTITDQLTKQAVTTAWKYARQRLIGIEHPTQTERYEYDSRGLLSTKTIELKRLVDNKLGDAPALKVTTRYVFDDQGVLQSSTLGDGSSLVYERNGQGQIVALKQVQLQTSWLARNADWLLPAQVIVQGLQRDLVGIKAFEAGNGVQARFERSVQGVLARTVYRLPVTTRVAGLGISEPGLARTTQDSIYSMLLGIKNANASDMPFAAPSMTKALEIKWPGALGLAQETNAIIDHRYVWGSSGNLLFTQTQNDHTSYAYDHQHRLVVSNRVPGNIVNQSNEVSQSVAPVGSAVLPSLKSTVNRYAYESGRRVLAQENAQQGQAQMTNTNQVSYAANSHRWLSQRAANQGDEKDIAVRPHTATTYNSSGQPLQLGIREYAWDALGRMSSVREKNQPLASYTYNHRGERIAKQVHASQEGQAPVNQYYLYEQGQLSAELNAKGELKRQYIYLADQPIAIIDFADGKLLANGTAQSESTFSSDLGLIISQLWERVFSREKSQRMVWLHTNHLGAPEAATDERAQVIWKASYEPFGAITIKSISSAGKVIKISTQPDNSFTLNLRLPGQYEDSETGLYYNKHRYYDSKRGEYLSADPLGTPDGPNGYSYARYNPLRYVDPEGLILFAFDGTNNTDIPADLTRLGNGISNVVLFRDLYQSGGRRYITGVGTEDRSDPERPIRSSTLDAARNVTGVERITRMIEYFGIEANDFDDSRMMDVDVIGFSRGASQARDFTNQITAASTQTGTVRVRRGSTVQTQAVYSNGIYQQNGKTYYRYLDDAHYAVTGNRRYNCQWVNFRFMGLWDTVLSTDINLSRGYELGISGAFTHVAHAVALNEYRGNTTRDLPGVPISGRAGAFPLESILGSPAAPGQTRIERGFIGAHADIGGGFPEANNENVLAQVSLSWMVQQARSAGVTMLSPTPTIIANPVIHDKSEIILTGGMGAGEDRTVKYRDGTSTTQRRMVGTGLTFAEIERRQIDVKERFINFDENRGRTDGITGTVNMCRYLAWLRGNGYDIGSLRANGCN